MRDVTFAKKRSTPWDATVGVEGLLAQWRNNRKVWDHIVLHELLEGTGAKKNKRKNPGNREPKLVTEARVGGAEVGSTRVSVAVFCRGARAQECCGHIGRATARSARSEK